jgi:hypothetical protein
MALVTTKHNYGFLSFFYYNLFGIISKPTCTKHVNEKFDIIDCVTSCYHSLSVMIQTIETQIQKHLQCSSNTHSPS